MDTATKLFLLNLPKFNISELDKLVRDYCEEFKFEPGTDSKSIKKFEPIKFSDEESLLYWSEIDGYIQMFLEPAELAGKAIAYCSCSDKKKEYGFCKHIVESYLAQFQVYTR